MPAKKKSCLMTPDPYHTPGYAGYLPQFKYDMGQTFGIHTHKLLTSTDPKVAASGNLVLCEIFPSPDSSPSTNVDFGDSAIYSNTMRSWGDQKYKPNMVPGYAGIIPKRWQHFGSRYAESCHDALTSFEQDQHKHRAKTQELHTLTHGQANTQSPPNTATSNMTTPLRPLRKKAKPYYSPRNEELVSPYCIPDDQPTSRYHMSGYMGFVPKAQRFIAQGYPIITHQALQQHESETEKQVLSKSQPVTVHRPQQQPVKLMEIYPKERGLVPRYQGFVPGQKFRFGGTFGYSTRDVLRPEAAYLTTYPPPPYK